MTFPTAELKFVSIRRADDSTHVTVRLYVVRDGGLDASGHQLYDRTLRAERHYMRPGYISTAEILAYAQARLAEFNVSLGLNWSADRLICAL
jgi:hypothetical protein